LEGHPKKVVLDTNVLISVLLFEGRAAEIIALLENRTVVLIISKEIFKEYVQTLAYSKFRLTGQLIEAMVNEVILPYAEVVRGQRITKPICRDTKDDKFLAGAKAGRADAIVSGDQDLLVLKDYEGIPIISIDTFLRKFGF